MKEILKVVIGIITREEFFGLMVVIHRFIWKTEKPSDADMCEIFSDVIGYFILLMSGMDSDIAVYLKEYLISHDELDKDQLNMMFDYLSEPEEIYKN